MEPCGRELSPSSVPAVHDAIDYMATGTVTETFSPSTDHTGLLPREVWLEVPTAAGSPARVVPEVLSAADRADGREPREVFVAHRPA